MRGQISGMDQSQREFTFADTRERLARALDAYLPGEEYRAYYRWALSAANPDRELFCRINALDQLANLTASVLAGLDEGTDWPTLVGHAAPVNLYQVFEVVSDNLGIGLAAPGADPVRRELVLAFDAEVAAELRSPTGRPATELLADLRRPASVVSAFEQSLRPKEHRMVARRYADGPGRPTVDELDATVWDGLVANVESGRDVLTALAGTRTEPIVRDRTVYRYAAVDRTLGASALSREELLETSVHTILVTPTLGYFASVFGEILSSDPGYPAVLADGSLVAAFDTAALLVRLLNDVGTPLLEMSRAERAALVDGLRPRFAENGSDSAIPLLAAASGAVPALNRLRKDLIHGELNVCLYEVHRATGAREGLEVFLDVLELCADRYARARKLFASQLSGLDTRLRERRGVEVARRFVAFHERLYSRPYDAPRSSGDYAI
ncbi:hypothetical protein GCM10023321_38510 [Pseudonocardia eucalypti]|uniref:Uncharacterized protein n=2 Tax=Pseudonocardia eucalypti TaxID=648755 RepID=A0ABP9QBK0_9PSEU